jgi:tRNA(Arg) A34 adenosine deaminase TadA
MTDEDWMRLTIRKTQEGIAAGQSPFGSLIVRDSALIAAAHNSVWRDTNPTAHAEVNCIRTAARELKTIFLYGCTLYSTTEPCPMCMSAIHWARVERVVYGTAVADAAAAGFHELHVPAIVLVELGKSPVCVEGGLLREECAELFTQWQKAGLSASY